MNQLQFLAIITNNSFNTEEKSCIQGGIGFVFASHWFKNWYKIFLSQSLSRAIIVENNNTI